MDNLEPNGTRGDSPGVRPAYGVDFAPPALNVELRGRGRARRVRRAIREGFKLRAETAGSYEREDSAAEEFVVVVEPVGLPARKPEKQYLFPRRGDSKEMDSHVGPPMMPRVKFKVGRFRTFRRLLVYAAAAIRFYWRVFKDILRRRNTVERRAVHLRRVIEGLGGTAIKLGQQASLRMDMFPYQYCAELEKMLDRVPAFPTEQAIERIEAVTGRPLKETFAEFNPDSHGSGSVACIYDAVLVSGQRVAVKVRRPGIRDLFLADCNALEWVLRFLEFLTLLRDGYTKPLVFGLRTILLEEADFVKEARHTELFRRRARKRLSNVSAPKIHFDLSGEDVIVQDFVTGVKMGDMIAFVEQKDEAALEQLRRLNIDPEKVARKLIRVNQFGVFENILFHADPHPSNLIVRPDNTIVFIDFGAVGAYTTRERNNWRQLNYYHRRRDVGRMAQTALAILEPLPPINLDEFRERLEQIFWQDIYAHESKHSEWYEHTSVNIWRSLFELSYEFNVPMNLNTLRMIRSTLLSETVAARLYPGVSAWREHQKYNKRSARRSRKRVLRGIAKRICGPTDTDYQRIEQLKGIFNRTVYLYQRFIDNPLYRYQLLIRKVAYAFVLIVKTVLKTVMITTGLLIILIARDIIVNRRYTGDAFRKYMATPFITENFKTLVNPADEPQPTPAAAEPPAQPATGQPQTQQVQGEVRLTPGRFAWLRFLPSRIFLFFFLVYVFLNMRRMLLRFRDNDIRRRNTSGLS